MSTDRIYIYIYAFKLIIQLENRVSLICVVELHFQLAGLCRIAVHIQ